MKADYFKENVDICAYAKKANSFCDNSEHLFYCPITCLHPNCSDFWIFNYSNDSIEITTFYPTINPTLKPIYFPTNYPTNYLTIIQPIHQ